MWYLISFSRVDSEEEPCNVINDCEQETGPVIERKQLRSQARYIYPGLAFVGQALSPVMLQLKLTLRAPSDPLSPRRH